MIVGVDTGGTFTDLIFLDESGEIRIRKVPSTPSDPSEAVSNGLQMEAEGHDIQIIHGTTVATNALLERRGAKTALITTQGCRDVLEIGRQTRPDLYALTPAPRIPLIPRELRYEVTERLDWQGQVVTSLDNESVERALDAIQSAGIESVAVCLLFSFLNPIHEQDIGRRARRRSLHVSLSHEIAPEFREYERTSTVCANACVGPVMGRYLTRLQCRLESSSSSSSSSSSAFTRSVPRLSIMQSNGGTLRAEEAAANAVKTVLSGPAGGIIAAVHTAKQAGIERIITFDMGGTSTDAALVDGEPQTVRTGEVAELPLLTPMLDIHTVGAGGGSIARIDAGGALRVGPESAGADPGPVAYGKGDRVTVTDANSLLSRLPASVRLAGTVSLDLERVRERLHEFAAEMGLSPEQAAEGIVTVVNAQMARALRHISVERGHDPSDYTLVAFGGAGGLHACALAEALGMTRVLIPRYPGAFSALGLALADVRRELVRSYFLPADDSRNLEINGLLDKLISESRADLALEGINRSEMIVDCFVEARYTGQSYALRVPYRGRLAQAARAFHRAHRARYGHADPTQKVEIVAVGVAARGARARPKIRVTLPSSPGSPCSSASVWIDGSWQECPAFDRESLALGQEFQGPAVILQPDATTWIAPNWTCSVDSNANILNRMVNK